MSECLSLSLFLLAAGVVVGVVTMSLMAINRDKDD